MKLGFQQAIASVVPVALLGFAGLFMTLSAWNTQITELHHQVAESTVFVRTHFDDIARKVARASDELSHRNLDFNSAIERVQAGQLSDFFRSYLNGLQLVTVLSDVNWQVVYRSVDPSRFGDYLSEGVTGAFELSVKELDGKWLIATGARVLSYNAETLGFLITGIELNSSLVKTIIPDTLGLVSIGTDSRLLTNNGELQGDGIRKRDASQVVPSVWIELSRNSSLIDSHSKRTLYMLSALLMVTIILAGIVMWFRTHRAVIAPVYAIHNAIVKGDGVLNVEALPHNEIGELGRALAEQKAELRSRTDRLENATVKLQHESLLIQVLSHDVSTPLTAITMLLSKLKGLAAGTPDVQNVLVRMSMHVETIISIISHVRDMRSLESGKRSLELASVDVSTVVGETISMFADRLAAKEITLKWTPEDCHRPVVVDLVSFRVSVLSNILANAIKFSNRGGDIVIRCSDAGDQTRIEITDFGKGIPKDLREKLFSPTKATTRRGSEGEAGTGYGMPLIKFYVGLYGGDVVVESKTEDESPTKHGTTIILFLRKTLTIHRS